MSSIGYSFAGAGLVVAGAAGSLAEGVARAQEAIDSGAARGTLVVLGVAPAQVVQDRERQADLARIEGEVPERAVLQRYRDIAVLNAGAGLVVAGAAGSLAEGVARAQEAIDSGAARGLDPGQHARPLRGRGGRPDGHVGHDVVHRLFLRTAQSRLSRIGNGDEARERAPRRAGIDRLLRPRDALGERILDDLRGGDPEHNAAALGAVLEGARNAYRDIAVLNAGAADRG
jgi:anthranilate phosphoribosyltransferase